MSLVHPIQYGEARFLLEQFFQTTNFSKIAVLCDEHTHEHCLPVLDVWEFDHYLIMKPGEEHKHLQTCSAIWKDLIEHNFDRNSLLINLGGGVVTDLGGFVASCYKRGIQFLNIPTSLLAMVDASVGGKTGVDFAHVKNSIGAFSNPQLVIIDEHFLQTLPHRHMKNGIAEIIKHGLIADAKHLEILDEAVKNNEWQTVIKESVAIKKNVVESDPYEKGLRKILNFGHTIGHAIESYSLQHDKDILLHGEAIALGMLAEADLSMKYCGLRENEFLSIKQRINKVFKQTTYNGNIDELINLMNNDKKNENQEISMSLLSTIGKATFNVTVNKNDIANSLKRLAS